MAATYREWFDKRPVVLFVPHVDVVTFQFAPQADEAIVTDLRERASRQAPPMVDLRVWSGAYQRRRHSVADETTIADFHDWSGAYEGKNDAQI